MGYENSFNASLFNFKKLIYNPKILIIIFTEIK